MSEPLESAPLAVVPVRSTQSTVDFFVVGFRSDTEAGERLRTSLWELIRLQGTTGTSATLRRESNKLADLLVEAGAGDQALVIQTKATARTRELARSVSRLIEFLEPEIRIPMPPAVLQARRNAEARAALLLEFGALTSREVAEYAGSNAENRAAIAASWKQQNRIFSVPYRGKQVFPGFQFGSDGRPHAVIAEVIGVFGKSHEWQLALWFVARNGFLGGRRPVDLVEAEPHVIAEAAKEDTDNVAF